MPEKDKRDSQRNLRFGGVASATEIEQYLFHTTPNSGGGLGTVCTEERDLII